MFGRAKQNVFRFFCSQETPQWAHDFLELNILSLFLRDTMCFQYLCMTVSLTFAENNLVGYILDHDNFLYYMFCLAMPNDPAYRIKLF